MLTLILTFFRCIKKKLIYCCNFIKNDIKISKIKLRNEYLRPQLNYNGYDERYQVDRASCNGIYQVVNRVPICPINNLTKGRNFLYWGPNHALIIILTTMQNNRLQVLVKKSSDSSSFKFPRVTKLFLSC